MGPNDWDDLPPVIGERMRDAFADIFRSEQESRDGDQESTSEGPGAAGAAER